MVHLLGKFDLVQLQLLLQLHGFTKVSDNNNAQKMREVSAYA